MLITPLIHQSDAAAQAEEQHDEEWVCALRASGACAGLSFKERLVLFYTAKNPEKLDTIDELLTK